ncbi:MAG TPA: Ldh family oxidoreductase [Solirubrobacteraceae bacterium]|nr:Ldh family oxidoreductase [Solirubrobacteraceae bacterium]
MGAPLVTLTEPALRELLEECFARLGLGRGDAAAVADVLLYANLRGIDSHGIDRAPVYMRRLAAGAARGTEAITVATERGGLRRLDAGHAVGPAAAVRAMDDAVALAARHGVGLVVLGRASNFAAAGYYALRAAETGRLALVSTNTPPIMAPHGASAAFLGSNPLALAVPLGDRDPLVLDMSTTVSARGRIRRAAAAGVPIGAGCALDSGGAPTTDAAAAMAGSLLPVGGAKGSGLALALGVFLALLAGSDFDDEAASIYADATTPQNLGQLFLAIDPAAVGDLETWPGRCAALVSRLRSLPLAEGAGRVRYPGEGAAETARHRRRHGIPVEVADLEALATACEECGLADLAKRALALAGGSGVQDPA